MFRREVFVAYGRDYNFSSTFIRIGRQWVEFLETRGFSRCRAADWRCRSLRFFSSSLFVGGISLSLSKHFLDDLSGLIRSPVFCVSHFFL